MNYIDSTIAYGFSFKCGPEYYVPACVSFTYLAQNDNDPETWSVIDGIQDEPLVPHPAVVIQIDARHNRVIEGTTNKRKLLVTWSAFIHGQVASFSEAVDFELTAQPIITNEVEDTVIGNVELVYDEQQCCLEFDHPVGSFVLSVNGAEVNTVARDTILTKYDFNRDVFEAGENEYTITRIEPLESFVCIPNAEGTLELPVVSDEEQP